MKLRSLFFGTLCMLMLGVSLLELFFTYNSLLVVMMTMTAKKTMKVRRWNCLKIVSTF